MIIRDKWYIIVVGKNIINYGNGSGFRVDSGIHAAAEFDTEAEMLQYIEDNNLDIVEVENEID
jgi:hypothetical protein